jgi:hypothetical protein
MGMKDLTIKEMTGAVALPDEYVSMLQKIETNYPAIKRDTDSFYKTQSQFMDNMLTVSAPTELRNLRQILAEINKAKMALQESHFAGRKKEIEILKKEELLKSAIGLDADLLNVEIAEIEMQLTNTRDYVKGAVRKISAYMTQYDNILKKIGKTELTEEDFEDDEERYHIMKAFEQGLCAARSHGGVIDEGNQIYFHQIGVNGTVAQAEVGRYLSEEWKLIESGKEPAHEMTIKFLEYCARKFRGCAREYAERKGQSLIDYDSLGKKNG